MKFSDAIRDALFLSMRMDEKVLCYGLGVPDPKGIFGTTTGLQEEFGSERVFDMPLSENAMTGVAIGAAIRGYRPVMAHQRFDFFLLAMDQLVNGAAKWHMMFGGRQSIPLTIRLIVGRGWGQGPTHCQSLHGWLAHIPGLKVVMPSNPANAKGLLMESIQDPNPVIFVEHRWLHGMEGTVPSEAHNIPLGRAALLEEGDDLTIVASSLMVAEARHAIDFLRNDIKIDLIDLQTIRPIDWSCIFQSVQKTGRLLVLDIGSKTGSLAGEIIASVASEFGSKMKCPPERICMPDHAVPTSFSLTKDIYPNAREIAQRILKMMNLEKTLIAWNEIFMIFLGTGSRGLSNESSSTNFWSFENIRTDLQISAKKYFAHPQAATVSAKVYEYLASCGYKEVESFYVCVEGLQCRHDYKNGLEQPLVPFDCKILRFQSRQKRYLLLLKQYLRHYLSLYELLKSVWKGAKCFFNVLRKNFLVDKF